MGVGYHAHGNVARRGGAFGHDNHWGDQPMLQSFFVINVESGEQPLFYDTILDGKHLFTAVGVGAFGAAMWK